MNAGVDGCFEMIRSENRWGGQEDDVNARIDNFLIRIKSDEFMAVRYGHLITHLFLNCGIRLLQVVRKNITHCGQSGVFIRCEGLYRSTRSSSTASDQSNL